MPNANITIYFNDNDFIKYVKHKQDINTKAREVVKKLISQK